MIKLKSPRIALSGICVLAATVVTLAYGIPYFQENNCQQLAADYLKHNPVSGASFFSSGPIKAKASDIKIRITGPFESEASYSVPNLMHGIIYTHKCSVSLFSTSLGAREEHHTM